MTDQEYINKFKKLSERDKHEYKTMMYCILDAKRIVWHTEESRGGDIYEQS